MCKERNFIVCCYVMDGHLNQLSYAQENTCKMHRNMKAK